MVVVNNLVYVPCNIIMKTIPLGQIYAAAKGNRYYEFENIIHKSFRGTLETVAKEEMNLMDCDDFISINQIQELINFFSGKHIDKKFIIEHLEKLKDEQIK